jgi:hypothetical protein
LRPAETSLAAVIDPPYPDPITTKSYRDLRVFQSLASMEPPYVEIILYQSAPEGEKHCSPARCVTNPTPIANP